MINIDMSCLYVLGILTVLNVVLNRLLYRPILTNYHQRRDHILSMRNEAHSNSETARIIRLETHAVLTVEKRKAEAERRQLREMTQAEARALIESATRRTEAFIDAHQAGIEADKDRIRKEMDDKIDDIAHWFRDRLLPLCLAVSLAVLGMAAAAPETRAADPYVNPHAPRTGTPVADGSHGGEASGKDILGHHKRSILPDIEKGFNLFLLSLILFIFLRKPVGKMFRHRAETVRKAIESSEHELEFSARELNTAETERANIESAKKSIRRKYHRQDQKIHEEILDDARRKTREIEEKSHQIKHTIDIEAVYAMNRDIVDRTLERIHTDFAGGIDLETDRKLVAECIDRLERLPDGGGLIHARHSG